ncbi:hypothetical protein BDV23DRAFT_178973 [Aspergillus alliaceus]|uniref:Nucleotide-diphospho-sugar transferase n=1 Tax=Petromyces alliaceus TaxID=209559 RepID=A0A5N7CL75_PETAA|nr:hypothetical protein BDV23DRAFT_178973 [Aspergillus alliaceus]
MLLSHRLRRFSKLSIAGMIAFCCLCALYVHLLCQALDTAAQKGDSPWPTHKPKIPRKIWYKVGPGGETTQPREWMNDCQRKNPSYAYDIITDQFGERYVRKNFASRPDIFETYRALPLLTHKADLLRYFILFAEGGIWYDSNVSCEDTPISDWVPKGFKDMVGLVVGLEFDARYDDTVDRRFATWIITAAPDSPHILRVIEDIVDTVREATEGGGVSKDTIHDVVNFTGAGAFTRGIFKSLGLSLKGTFARDSMYNVRPVLIADVMIMPRYSFVASVNTYKNPDVVGPPLVRHHDVSS